jgi:hypothetical protein
MNPELIKNCKSMPSEMIEWFKESYKLERIEEENDNLKNNMKFWCQI